MKILAKNNFSCHQSSAVFLGWPMFNPGITTSWWIPEIGGLIFVKSFDQVRGGRRDSIEAEYEASDCWRFAFTSTGT